MGRCLEERTKQGNSSMAKVLFVLTETAIRLTFQSSKSHQQEILKQVILQKLAEDRAAGSVAVNAAFGNQIKAPNPILLTGNNSHRKTNSIASLHSFPIRT
jgi:hypothetical protein